MYPTSRAALLAVAVSVFVTACGGAPSSPAVAPAASAADAQLDAQQALTAKLNAYIGCFNRVDSQIHAGAKYYAGSFQDPVAGPTGRETRMIGPYDVSDYDMTVCGGPLTDAIAAPPSLPDLDAAAGRYHQALEALRPLSHQLRDYYERGDNEDDDFAKGKQLHAPLMSALSDFVEASEAFSAELDAQNDAAQREQLKVLEQAEGRTREYYRLAMMLDAKEIIGLMQDDAFDLARASELLQQFNQISDEAHAKVADQDPGKLDWNSFETSAEKFRREGKARLKRVTEKTPYTALEKRWLTNPTTAPEGSPTRLLKAYNDLVFQSNRQ